MPAATTATPTPATDGPERVAPGIANRSLDDLVALDPTIRVEIGTPHTPGETMETASRTPSIWIWSTGERFAPQRFQESTFEASVSAAHAFLSDRLAAAAATLRHRALRTRDEQEGGIIIPDYMY